jgi:hypothetical protein
MSARVVAQKGGRSKPSVLFVSSLWLHLSSQRNRRSTLHPESTPPFRRRHLPLPLMRLPSEERMSAVGAQNETSIAIDPNNPNNLIGGANDYRNGDAQCGRYTSNNKARTWRISPRSVCLLP